MLAIALALVATSPVHAEMPGDLVLSSGDGKIDASWQALHKETYATRYTVQWEGGPFEFDPTTSEAEPGSKWWIFNGVHVLGSWGNGRYAEVHKKSDGSFSGTVWLSDGVVRHSPRYEELRHAKLWAEAAIEDYYDPWAYASEATKIEGTSYTTTGLVNGTTYRFRVKAFYGRLTTDLLTNKLIWIGGFGESEWSEVSSAMAGVPPEVPGAPTLASGNLQLDVSWTAPDDNGAAITGYTVQWRDEVSESDNLWDDANEATVSGTATSYTITGLTNTKTQSVRVKATNGVGDSEWSDVVSGWPVAVPKKPGAPTLAPGIGLMDVFWSSPHNNRSPMTGYTVQWKSGSQDYDAQRQATVSTTTGYQMTGLTNGTTYSVRVKATNGVGDSEWSNASSAMAGVPPEVPGALALTAGISQVELSWTAPEGNGLPITEYTVQWRDDGAFDPTAPGAAVNGPVEIVWTTWGIYAGSFNVYGGLRSAGGGYQGEVRPNGTRTSPVIYGPVYAEERHAELWTEHEVMKTYYPWYHGVDATVSADATGHTITGLKPGTPYSVRIKAANATGDSEWSVHDSATTPAAPEVPGAPTLASGNLQLDVSWTAPDDNGAAITGYTVQWRDEVSESDNLWDDANEATVSGTATSYTITGLTNTKTQSVRVKATNGVGDSEWSDVVSGWPVAVPKKPGAPTLAPGIGLMDVFWSSPHNNRSPMTGYTVQWKSGSQDYDAQRQATVSTTTGYQMTGLTNGTTYSVRVKATNGVGDSEWSNASSAMAGVPPEVPGALALTAGISQVELSWTAPEGNGLPITEYTVQWRDDGAFDPTAPGAAVNGPVEIVWTTWGIYAGSFNVYGGLRSAGGGYQGEVRPNGTRTSPVIYGPVYAEERHAELWTEHEVMKTYYPWYHGVDATVSADATGHTITGLKPGTPYSVRIKAANATGYSDWSATSTSTSVGLALSDTVFTLPEGETTSYTVSLTSEPSGEATVRTARDGVAAATVSPATLTFTAANWSVPQRVTVTVSDDEVDNPEGYDATIGHTISIGDETVATDDVKVSVSDNDEAELLITDDLVELDFYHTDEIKPRVMEGDTFTYWLALNSNPRTFASDTNGSVTVTLTTDSNAVTVSPGTVTFGVADGHWLDLFEKVTLTAVDNEADEGNQAINVSYEVSGSPEYAALDIPDTLITVIDDEHKETYTLSVSPDSSHDPGLQALEITEQGGPQRLSFRATLGSGEVIESMQTILLTFGGNATEEVDYTVEGDRYIKLGSGASSPTTWLTITPTADENREGAETIIVTGEYVARENPQPGDGVVGTDVIITIADSSQAVPGKPAAPTVTASSSSSLTVTWSAPANTGSTITDYDVQYREGASSAWTDAGHSGTATTAIITGLKAATSYQAQVRASNADGAGPWSDSGTGSTEAEKVPAITDVSVSHPATATVGEDVTVTITVTGEVAASGKPYRWIRVGIGNEWRSDSSSRTFQSWPTTPGTRSWEVFVTGTDGVEYSSGQFSITWEN